MKASVINKLAWAGACAALVLSFQPARATDGRATRDGTRAVSDEHHVTQDRGTLQPGNGRMDFVRD